MKGIWILADILLAALIGAAAGSAVAAGFLRVATG